MAFKWDKQVVEETAKDLLLKGYRVFLAKDPKYNYGIYSDTKGTRVCYFQNNLGGMSFNGCYKSAGKGCGSGWRLETDDYHAMLHAHPPRWATMGYEYKLHTLDSYLKSVIYDNYKEIFLDKPKQPINSFNDCK